MKKVWKGAAAVIAALSLGVTGFVGASSAYALTDGKASITINNYNSSHSYKIYQLMTGDVSTQGSGADAKEVITNAKWGTGATKSGDVSTTDLNTIAGYETAKDQGTQATIAKAIIDNYVDTADATKGTIFTNGMELDPGYYVLIDQTTPGNNDSKALPIIALLQKGEEFSINEKHDTVTAIKKVKENNKTIAEATLGHDADPDNNVEAVASNTDADSRVVDKIDDGYNDTADYNIGDDVEYEFIASVPENIDKYDYYKYTFTDTLSEGLTFNKDVKVYLGDSPTALADTNYTVTETTTPKGFTVNFGDGTLGLKAVDGVLDKDGKRAVETIKIKFSAKLNANAVVTTTAGNDGNVNTMKLTYSSNPQDTAEFKETPEDSVIVFTYKLDFNKVDGTNADEKLEGAQFVISRTIKDENGQDKTQYAKADENGKLSGWLNTEPTAVDQATDVDAARALGVFISNGNEAAFGVQGLDDGTYTLKEIKAPEGYSIGQNHTFVIKGTLGTDGKGLQNWTTANALTAVKLNVDGAQADVDWAAQNITNSKQSNLPETGGMGTVVLYTVGGLIVLIAGVGLAIALRRRQA